MFLKISRLMYFDTLNSNMMIANRHKKPFSSYKKNLIYKKKIGKYRGHHRCFSKLPE